MYRITHKGLIGVTVIFDTTNPSGWTRLEKDEVKLRWIEIKNAVLGENCVETCEFEFITRHVNTSALDFIATHLRTTIGDKVETVSVYNDYLSYCNELRARPIGRGTFYKLIRRRFGIGRMMIKNKSYFINLVCDYL